MFVNAARRSYSDLANWAYPIPTTDDSDEFLTDDNFRATLHNPDGSERCSFTDSPANATGRMTSDGMALVLDRQVVFGTRDGLVSFDRSTCAPIGGIPTS